MAHTRKPIIAANWKMHMTPQETEEFLSNFAIRELSAEIARRTADLRFHRRSLKIPDAVILATAQEHGAILVTRNTRDFPASTPGVRVPYKPV